VYEEKNTFYIKPFYRDKNDGKSTRRVFPHRLPIEISSPLTRYCETCHYPDAEQRRQRAAQTEQLNILREMRKQLEELREQSKGSLRRAFSDPQVGHIDSSRSFAAHDSQGHNPKDEENDVPPAENLNESFNESMRSSNEAGEECAQSFDVSHNLENSPSTNTSMTELDPEEQAAITLLNRTSLLDPPQDNLLPKFDFETEAKSPELDPPDEITPPDPPTVIAYNVTHTERCNYLLFGPPGKHRASSPSPQRVFPPTIRQEHVKHLIGHLKHEPYIPMAPYTEYSQRIRPKTLEGQEYLPMVIVEAFMMKWMSKASYTFFEREDADRRKGCKARREEGLNMNLYKAVMRSAINTWTQNYEYEEPTSDEEEVSDEEYVENDMYEALFTEGDAETGEEENMVSDDDDEDWIDEDDDEIQEQI